MPKSAPRQILRLTEVEDHDYPAADACLRIIYPDARARTRVARLRKAPTVFTACARSAGSMKTR